MRFPKRNSAVVAYHKPFQITGFHSSDRDFGMRLLNGSDELVLATILGTG